MNLKAPNGGGGRARAKASRRGMLGATRFARGAALALTIAGASLLAAACDTAVVSPGVASIGTTTTTQASSSSGANSASIYSDELKFAECMRSNGVPNFPDPSANGNFEYPAGGNSSPAQRAAQAKCQKLLPGGGSPGSGTTTHPTAAALAQMLKVSQCMRRHGILNFPDPTTSIPVNRAGLQEISDRDGVIFEFPRSLDMQSPQFARAAAACNFPLTNH